MSTTITLAVAFKAVSVSLSLSTQAGIPMFFS